MASSSLRIYCVIRRGLVCKWFICDQFEILKAKVCKLDKHIGGTRQPDVFVLCIFSLSLFLKSNLHLYLRLIQSSIWNVRNYRAWILKNILIRFLLLVQFCKKRHVDLSWTFFFFLSVFFNAFPYFFSYFFFLFLSLYPLQVIIFGRNQAKIFVNIKYRWSDISVEFQKRI